MSGKYKKILVATTNPGKVTEIKAMPGGERCRTTVRIIEKTASVVPAK